MTTLQMASFLAAAKNKNFTKAAEELFSSQPTISRQIALLEEEVGFPLFNRGKKVLALTPGGNVMYQGLQDVLSNIDECIRQARQAMVGLEGSIALGCLSGTDTERTINPFTVCFSKAYPSIDVSMESGSYSHLRSKLDSGELDMVFTLSFELSSYADIQYRDYCCVDVFFIISEDHPLAAKPDLEVRDLMGETFYMPDPKDSHGRAKDLSRLLTDMGVDGSGLCVRYMPNLESILFAVRSGRGFAFSDSSMRHTFEGPYRRIPVFTNAETQLKLMLVWKNHNKNPSLPLLLEYWDNNLYDMDGALFNPLISGQLYNKKEECL